MTANLRTGRNPNAKDDRTGRGQPVGNIDVPAFDESRIGCTCSWTVITPGAGWNCIMRVKWINHSCPNRTRHVATAPVPSPAERLLTDIFGDAR